MRWQTPDQEDGKARQQRLLEVGVSHVDAMKKELGPSGNVILIYAVEDGDNLNVQVVSNGRPLSLLGMLEYGSVILKKQKVIMP